MIMQSKGNLLTKQDLIIKNRIEERHLKERNTLLFVRWLQFWDMIEFRPKIIEFKTQRLSEPASCPKCKEKFWMTCNECPYCNLNFNGDLSKLSFTLELKGNN